MKNFLFVAIVGSKERHEKQKIKEILLEKRKKNEIIVVSGGAKGIDEDVEIVCRQIGMPFLVIPPKLDDFKLKGNDIYFERNLEVAEIADEMVAFPLGYKCGTINTIQHFKKLGKSNKLMIY